MLYLDSARKTLRKVSNPSTSFTFLVQSLDPVRMQKRKKKKTKNVLNVGGGGGVKALDICYTKGVFFFFSFSTRSHRIKMFVCLNATFFLPHIIYLITIFWCKDM